MAGLVPFNRNGFKLAGVDEFHNMLDDFFGDAFGGVRRNLLNDTFKIDVQEDETAYTIEADLPGVKKEEVGLELNDGRFTISITREASKSEEKPNYVHRERRFSSMKRSIFLNAAHDEGVDASLIDGVLKIIVPKATPATKSKIIEIH